MSTDTDIKTEKLLIDSLFNESVRNSKIDPLSEVKISKLTGDASSRSYFRIEGHKRSYVACLDQSLTTLKKKEEVDFYSAQDILKNNGVNVPNIFDIDHEKGYVLQEDLGDHTFLKELSLIKSKQDEKNLYLKAIDELLNIQSIKKNETTFFKRSFDETKLMSEVDFTIKHLIDGLFDLELEKKRKEKIKQLFNKLVAEITEEPMVLTHRDYHSRNIMMMSGDTKVIDFQDMRLGLPQYDLVSLLEDCYYQINSDIKDELKKYYWEKAIERNILTSEAQLDWDGFCSLYNKMAIQRTFKALGSFAYIFRLREDIRYLKYIGYSFEQLKSLLFKEEKYSELRTLLAEVYYEY